MPAEIARFEIIGVLGTGTQGVVVLAHDHADASPEPIGLKVLKAVAADPASLERLREEARILAWLSHPNIVKVHRLLEKDGFPIVVMEHVAGASAREMVRPRAGLPPAVAVEVARRACDALEAAHDTPGPDGRPMRIVHRDIKPANVLVSLLGEVKLVDFGFAAGPLGDRPDDELVGSPGSVAPERRIGGPETSAVDVYALGATLYTMLTGLVLVPPASADAHDPWITRALVQLAPAGLDDRALAALRGLIGEICRFDATRRPGLAALVAGLGAVADLLDPPEMRAWAETHIAPILEARAERQARIHPAWPDLAFLEQAGAVRDLGLETPEPPRGLALRPSIAPPEPGPLLAKLDRSRWPFRKTPPETLVEALVGLLGSRDPRAVTRAWELTEHRDPRVAEAAWELLAGAC